MDEKPFYVTPDGKLEFFKNTADGPRAYVIRSGEEYMFSIPDRTLNDLTSPQISTESALESLSRVSGSRAIIKTLHLSQYTPEQLHVALLHLRIQADEFDRLRKY